MQRERNLTMQITNEMVNTAFDVFSSKTIWNKNAMHDALEAALGAQPKMYTDILLALRGVTPGNKLAHDAASCIEDLAGALKPFAKESDNWGTTPDDDSPLAYTFDLPDGYGIQQVMCGFTAKDFYRARATLERWGLK